MTAAIEINGLTKRFGQLVAVDNLSLAVPHGSVFGFLGANGAGKTTTIRVIAGLSRPTAGSVTVAGVSASSGAAYRRQLGYLCQEPAFYGWMTGREVLRYAAGFHAGIEKPEKRVEALLAQVGLADAAGRKVAGYSGGMKQRLGIAAAVVGQPAVVLLDEPAAGLDPLGRRDVLDLIEALRETTTVFFSTHILDDVQRVSDRVAVLDRGRLLAADTTENLLASAGRNRIHVVLAGAGPEAGPLLAGIPGVENVAVGESRDGATEFTLQLAAPDATAAAQLAVTELALAHGLAVVEARPLVFDLEEVFLRLVGRPLVGGAQATTEKAA
jgi:ABC-2 type transport system ATP-binding protein